MAGGLVKTDTTKKTNRVFMYETESGTWDENGKVDFKE